MVQCNILKKPSVGHVEKSTFETGAGWKQETSREGTAVIQKRDDGGLDQGGSSEYDEKWSDYGYFKVDH